MYDGSQDGGDGCQTFQYEGQPELPNHLNPCVMVIDGYHDGDDCSAFADNSDANSSLAVFPAFTKACDILGNLTSDILVPSWGKNGKIDWGHSTYS